MMRGITAFGGVAATVLLLIVCVKESVADYDWTLPYKSLPPWNFTQDCQCRDNCKDNLRHDQPCVLVSRTTYPRDWWEGWTHEEELQECDQTSCHYAPCDNGKHITTARDYNSGWGGRGHTVDGLKKTIGTACDCDQIPTRCCDNHIQGATDHYNYVGPTDELTQKLLRPASDRTAWTRPLTGFNDKNQWVDRWHLDIYCNKIPTPTPRSPPANPKTYRTMMSISGVEHGVNIPEEPKGPSEKRENCQYTRPTGEHVSQPHPLLSTIRPNVPGGVYWRDYTNKLRFSYNTIAQEGMSFWLIGTHYRQSADANWQSLIAFLPLAEKSVDIGNHIDPDDSTKMKPVQRPEPWQLRGQHADSVGKRPAKLPDHCFENVWFGVLPVEERPDKGGGISKDPVPPALGFERRLAHPEWQPDPQSENPYKVSVTPIESDGIHVKNYLHIKVYAEPVSQPYNKRSPTSRTKYLMLKVRDAHGLPVGQCTHDVPCDQAETTCPDLAKPCHSHTGTRHNNPNISMYTVVKGRPKKTNGPGDTCKDPFKEKEQRNASNSKYKENRNDYVTEVHATWRFAQMDDGMVSELHFVTRAGRYLFKSPWVETPSVNCHVQINLETDDEDAPHRPATQNNSVGEMPLRETLKRWLDHKYRLKSNNYDYPNDAAYRDVLQAQLGDKTTKHNHDGPRRFRLHSHWSLPSSQSLRVVPVDRMLNLNPPCAYLPPPMMGVFHTDRSKFRGAVLLFYFLGLAQFYAYLHITLRYSDSEDPHTN